VIEPAVRLRLEAYLDELYRWNERLNLTAVPRAEAWPRHVEESRRLLEALSPAAGARVVDVGSGCGVPGIVIAVLRDDLRLTLLEADARRSGFLVHACGLLGLAQVEVVQRRAEIAGHEPAWREAFDHATSRAAAPPPALCELALPLVRVGGTLLCLVGDAAAAAAASRRAAALCGGGQPEAVGEEMLSVVKERPTPEDYPRRPGVPVRRPH
jgi:16S rRNA (guanine527-N7)-methyltransferase